MHAVNEELEEEELRDIFYFSFLLSQSIDFEQRNKVRSEFIYKKKTEWRKEWNALCVSMSFPST